MSAQAETLPSAELMIAQLTAVNEHSQFVRTLYPKLAMMGGRNMTPADVVEAFSQAVRECVESQVEPLSNAAREFIYRIAIPLLEAMSPNPSFAAQVKECWKEAQRQTARLTGTGPIDRGVVI